MTTTPTTPSPAAVPQVRLPGQAAAPEGPVDLLMMYVLHHAFRRDLAAFAAAVPLTPVEDLATWRALHDRWTRFAQVLHKHHSGEDAGLWPLLLERVDAAGDAAGRATLEAMEAEHGEIDPLLTSCAAGLQRMAAGGTVDHRAALAVRTAAARDALGRHLAHEETDAMVLVQRHLTDDDWLDLEKRYFAKEDTPALLLFAVPWVCLGLPDDVLRHAFALKGQALRVLWLLTRRRFARQHRQAFAAIL
jgi:hemerythrin-like domain-containing protein